MYRKFPTYRKQKPKHKANQAHPYAGSRPDGAAGPAANPLTTWGMPGTASLSPDGITSIHIYDFDNTLFLTPTPNHELFTGQAMNVITNPTLIHCGGWWQDVRFLQATGNGWEKETETAWKGWWNEDIVKLVQDSMSDPSVLTILLTGRKRHFATMIQQMCTAKGLVFDAYILRSGSFADTLAFKINFLTETLEYFKHATKIDIYEDRVWHYGEFKQFLKEYKQAMRNDLNYNVILVTSELKFTDPEEETALVQQAVQAHNDAFNQKLLSHPLIHRLKISEIHLFTGYIIKSESRARLLNEYLKSVPDAHDGVMRFHANAIVIRRMTVSKKDAATLNYGKHYKWRATHFGESNGEQWALKVEPIGFESRAEMPMVILAQRKRTPGHAFASEITEWTPLENQIEFETQLGDRSVMNITKKQ